MEVVIYLKNVLRKTDPDCVFLMETKGKKEKMERLCRKLGYFEFVIVEPSGLAGGLTMMWKKELDIQCLWKSNRVICCSFKPAPTEEAWNFYGCYGTPYPREKEKFWKSLNHTIQEEYLPWVMFGDLNEVVAENEKLGGRSIWKRRLCLKNFLQEVDGIDLGFVGRKFTWENKQQGIALIKERLDRAVASRSWIHRFPQAVVEHLPLEESDHCPIVIKSEGATKTSKHPFRFLQAWVSDASSRQVVDSAWNMEVKGGMESHKILRRLNSTTKALREWNKHHF